VDLVVRSLDETEWRVPLELDLLPGYDGGGCVVRHVVGEGEDDTGCGRSEEGWDASDLELGQPERGETVGVEPSGPPVVHDVVQRDLMLHPAQAAHVSRLLLGGTTPPR
jgi:hypothetical protein